jgi:hypothetical protein
MTSDLLTNPNSGVIVPKRFECSPSATAILRPSARWRNLSLIMNFWRGGRRNDYAEARETTALIHYIAGFKAHNSGPQKHTYQRRTTSQTGCPRTAAHC